MVSSYDQTAMTPDAVLGAAFGDACDTVRARSGAAPHTTWLELAGRPVRMSIAGERLAEVMLTALRHLRLAGESEPPIATVPALEIEVWDACACGQPCPIRYLRDSLPHTWPFGRAVLGRSHDGRVLGYQSHSLFGVLNLDGNRLVAVVDDARRLSLFEQGKPLQPLLLAWHDAIGAIPVHAGLVARAGRGVLLGGAGGSGKSTTSLLCWEAGFDYLGDDYIALPPATRDGRFIASSLYTSTWLTPEHSRRFPRLAEKAHHGTEEDDKLLVMLNEVDDARLARTSAVSALLLPRVTGGIDTTFRRASAAEAVLRLAPSSILQLPFVEARPALDRMHDLLRAVPAYWLQLGTSFPGIPRAVDAILREVDRG